MIRKSISRVVAALVLAGTTVLTSGGSATAHHRVLHTGANSTLSNYTVEDVAVSPSFASDNTIFALASDSGQCTLTCNSLFKSADGGATWTLLPGNGLGDPGGEVLLPPTYPTDNRIFVSGVEALFVSGDGGNNFTVAAPWTATPAAMSPGFNSGDPRIVLDRRMVYNDGTGTTQPLDKVFPPDFTLTQTFFPPDHMVTGELLFGGFTGVGATRSTTVIACNVGAICTLRWSSPSHRFAPELVFSDSYATDDTVYLHGGALLKSTDNGNSFTTLSMPAAGGVGARDMAIDPSGNLWLGMSGGLFKSADGGATWSQMGSTTSLDAGVREVEAMAGRIIAVPDGVDVGLRCSTDGGITWGTTC